MNYDSRDGWDQEDRNRDNVREAYATALNYGSSSGSQYSTDAAHRDDQWNYNAEQRIYEDSNLGYSGRDSQYDSYYDRPQYYSDGAYSSRAAQDEREYRYEDTQGSQQQQYEYDNRYSSASYYGNPDAATVHSSGYGVSDYQRGSGSGSQRGYGSSDSSYGSYGASGSSGNSGYSSTRYSSAESYSDGAYMGYADGGYNDSQSGYSAQDRYAQQSGYNDAQGRGGYATQSRYIAPASTGPQQSGYSSSSRRDSTSAQPHQRASERYVPNYAAPHARSQAHEPSLMSNIWVILALLIALPPLGMALLWSQEKFTLKGRLILSAISTTILLTWCFNLFNRSVGDPLNSFVGNSEMVSAYNSSSATAAPAATANPADANAAGYNFVDATTTAGADPAANAARTNENASLDTIVYALADGPVYYHRYAVCNDTSYPAETALGDALSQGLTACRRCNPPVYNSSAG